MLHHLRTTPGLNYYRLQVYSTDGELMDTRNAVVLIQAHVQGDFRMFPNPASDQLKFAFSGEAQNRQLSIFGMAGNLVLQEQFPAGSCESIAIDDLPAGAYIVQIRNGATVAHRRLIVQ